MKKNNGMALIAVVAFILVVSIMVIGLAGFVSTFLRVNSSRIDMIRAFGAAMGGADLALSDYNADPGNPYWSRIEARKMEGSENIFCSAGKDADFLMVDADCPRVEDFVSADDTLNNIPLSCLSLFDKPVSIEIDKIKTEWTGISGSLESISLGGGECWSGSASSGQIIDIDPNIRLYAINSADPGNGMFNEFSSKDDNMWRFGSPIPRQAVVAVTFYFTDGSSRRAILFNKGRSGNKEFSITSTGEVRKGSYKEKRTLRSTYDIGTKKITSFEEILSHI